MFRKESDFSEKSDWPKKVKIVSHHQGTPGWVPTSPPLPAAPIAENIVAKLAEQVPRYLRIEGGGGEVERVQNDPVSPPLFGRDSAPVD